MSPGLAPLSRVRRRVGSAADAARYRARRSLDALGLWCRGGLRWGPDRVVVSADLNPEYLFCVPLVVLFWNRRLGLPVALVAVGARDRWASDPAASLVLSTLADWGLDVDVLHVSETGDLASGHAAQVMRLWAPTQYPDAFSLLADGDMLPLNTAFFRFPRPAEDRGFVLLNADAYRPRRRWCMAYVGATGRAWTDLLGTADAAECLRRFGRRYRELTPGYDPARGTSSGGEGWYNDETILAERLPTSPLFPSGCRFVNSYRYCFARRLNRSPADWSRFVPARRGRYVDGHLYRALAREWAPAAAVIAAYLPAADAAAANTYRERWIRGGFTP